jgi:ABC-type branched-subunit amino acid transport system substrate-binding protein
MVRRSTTTRAAMNSHVRRGALAATAVCAVVCMLATAAFAGPAGAASVRPLLLTGATASDSGQVVVQRGGSIEIAFAPDLTGPTSSYTPSLADAVQMAVDAHPVVSGFPIQINTVNMPCGDATLADRAAAASIVGDEQNVGVIGPFCSTADAAALPIFEPADVVTVTGSTTNPDLPPLGRHVFNSVAVSDSCPGEPSSCTYTDLFDPWYAIVTTLPSDLAWGQAYESEFGSAPGGFADLYYDATSLLIRDVEKTSRIDGNGNLIINRAALAQAVRTTTNYRGVTCRITLDPATGYRLNDPGALAGCATP